MSFEKLKTMTNIQDRFDFPYQLQMLKNGITSIESLQFTQPETFKDHLAQYLDEFSWDMFGTITSGQYLTKAAAISLNERVASRLNKVFGGCTLFYACEPFDLHYGQHTHNLFRFEGLHKPTFNEVREAVNLVAGVQTTTHLRGYIESGGATSYCGKYCTKRDAHYDLLSSGFTKKSTRVPKHKKKAGEFYQSPLNEHFVCPKDKMPKAIKNYYESHKTDITRH